MDKNIPIRDFESAKPEELKKHYRVNDRQLENQLRNHLSGADAATMSKVYRKFYEGR